MTVNLTPFNSDGGFGTTGNVVAGNVLVVGNIGPSGDASPAPSLNGFNSVSAITLSASGNVDTGNINTAGSGGNIILTGGNITGVNVVTANLFSGKELTIISNVAATSNVAAVNIVGNNTGNELPAYNPGVAIHISGNQDLPARIYLDAIGYSNTTSTNAYPAFVGRAARGTVDAPSQLLGGDIIARFAGNPYNVDGFNTFTNTRIELVAAEDQTDATRGTQIEFWNTPIGSNTIAKTAVFDSNGIRLTGTNLNLVDNNDNDLVTISNVGNITFNGSSTLSLNNGFHVNTVGTNNGDGNIVNYVGGAFVYGPALTDYTGNIGANKISATGNITTSGNFVGNGATLSNVATQFKSAWTVTAGNGDYSFQVPANDTYQLWVRGNIPNGIIVYTATVALSNTNVPVLGVQYGWNYIAGGNLILNSLPSQFVGTAGAISNAAPTVTNTDVFTFNITNNSGVSQVVNYGWTKIS